VVTSRGRIQNLDLVSGAVLSDVEAPNEYHVLVGFNPDGKTFATLELPDHLATKPCSVAIWDARTKALLHSETLAQPFPRHLAYSPDGKHLLGHTVDEVVALDAATGKETRRRKISFARKIEVGFPAPMAICPQGRLVAIAAKNEIKILDWQGHGEPQSLP